MKNRFVVMTLGLLISGCLRSHQSDVKVGFQSSHIESVKQDCAELKQLGDFSQARVQLNRDSKQLLKLTNEPEIYKYEKQVYQLADRIHITVQTMIQMLDHKWNEPKWNHDLIWKIQLDGENFDGIIKAHVENVFLNGRVAPELAKKIKTRIVHDQLYVSLNKDSTSLEICELLNETFGIYLKITYGSVIRVSTHHRLTLKNERLLQ